MAKIIAIEGLDRSGKETQSKLLANELETHNIKVFRTSFPNYENMSSMFVKEYLNGRYGNASSLNAYQASLFFALDRFDTFRTSLNEKLGDYDVIIFDRYVGSNLLYQACKFEDDSEEQLKYFEYWSDFEFNKLELPKPDITIMLDMPVNVGKMISENRKNKIDGSDKQDIHETNDTYMNEVYSSAANVSKIFGWNIVKCYSKSFIGICTPKSIQDIHNEIWELVWSSLKISNFILD